MKDFVIQAFVGLDKMTYFLYELLALLRLRAGGQHREGTGLRVSLCCPAFFAYFFGLKKVGRRRQVPQIQQTFTKKSHHH